MMKPYGDCLYCGGDVVERATTIDYRYRGDLYILEAVPTGVCTQCGEQFFTAKVAHEMEAAVTSLQRPSRTIDVPVVPIGASQET